MKRFQLFRRLHDSSITDHREALGFQIIKQARLGVGRHLTYFTVAVCIKVQVAFGS